MTKLTKPTTGFERRQWLRRSCADEHGVRSARVKLGGDAVVINVSAGGALVETESRLLPGAVVELLLNTASHVCGARGRVLRSSVVRVSAFGVCYQAAVLFDRALPWLEPVSAPQLEC